MEVGVIYQSESIIDENNNFNIAFKNEEEIVELLFRKNRDFYLANAIAFVKNKFDKEIVDLEKNIKIAPATFPYQEVEIDYTKPSLLNKRLEKYKYNLETTSKNYLKNVKYFDVENESVKQIQIYDVVERLKDGITYTSTVNSLDEMYTKITFKLTPARKIEIRLTDSFNDGIRMYYYYWMNCIFIRVNFKWVISSALWIQQAQIIYKKTLREKGQFEANKKTTEYIWNFYNSRPSSVVIGNEKTYNLNRINFLLFKAESKKKWQMVGNYLCKTR